MSQTASFTEDSDEVEHPQEYCVSPTYGRPKHMDERQIYRNSRRSDYCLKCELHEIEPELDRRRRSKKNQLQYCRRCKSPSDNLKLHAGRTRHCHNMDAIVMDLENMNRSFAQIIKKPHNTSPRQHMCSYAAGSGYQHSKRRNASVHRHPHRSEQTEKISGIAETLGYINSGIHDSVEDCYISAKDGYRRDGHWDYQAPLEELGNSDIDAEPVINYKQHRKDRPPKSEPRMSKTNKLHVSGKNELTDDRYSELLRKKCENGVGSLRFNECEHEAQNKITDVNFEEDWKGRSKRNPNSLPSKLTTRSNSAKVNGSRTSRSKHAEEPTMNKSIKIDVNDYSEDDEQRKSHKRSTVRWSPSCKSEEGTTNKEEIKEDAQCEIIVKDDEEETEKNGSGDLCATKSRIIDLIDKVLSTDFGTAVDQPKNIDPARMLKQLEICIEITRALQSNCCQSRAEDLLVHREKLFKQPEKYIKQLKTLCWDHMNHIQNEFNKLCSLQKLLDTCSPRQSLPTLKAHLTTVEQRTEERSQQQPEENLKLGISS